MTPAQTPERPVTPDTPTPQSAHWSDALRSLSPCGEAMDYLKTQPDGETAWRECQRGDWMLWLAGKCAGPPESEGRKALVLAACACARLALPHFAQRYPHDGRVLACIETAERWARGWKMRSCA